jgi:hypothetical protein
MAQASAEGVQLAPACFLALVLRCTHPLRVVFRTENQAFVVAGPLDSLARSLVFSLLFTSYFGTAQNPKFVTESAEADCTVSSIVSMSVGPTLTVSGPRLYLFAKKSTLNIRIHLCGKLSLREFARPPLA